MSKRYLVRRENCRFIGPLTLDEFRQGIRKMYFGLEDEVAAHCSPWVVLDNESLVRKRYPELAAIVADEIPAAWREMTGHAKQLTSKEKRVRAEKEGKERPSRAPRNGSREKAEQKRKKKNQIILWGSLAAAILAGVTAVWIKAKEELLPPVSDYAVLAQQQDLSPFLNEMGLKIVSIASRVGKGKDKDGVWLPYLRMYAFHTNGAIDNFPSKILRGNVAVTAPQDCSVESWKRRWTESNSQMGGWNSGKNSAKAIWAKALTWDPWWIKRRPIKGWIRPRNWYEGCLMSASVAIRAVTSDAQANTESTSTNLELIAAISRRLQSQLEIIQTGKTSVALDLLSLSGQMTCVDRAESISALDACRQKQTDPWVQSQMDEYISWQLVRLTLAQTQGQIDSTLQTPLAAVIDHLPAEESSTKLDYSAELQYIREVQQAGFKVDGVAERISSQHGELKLNQ